MKALAVAVLAGISWPCIAQRRLSLSESIRLGIYGSREFALAQAELTATRIQSKIVRMQFLPSVTTSVILPNYSRSTTTVTIPDGRDIFVTQNQALYNAGLSIEQDEPWLGGKLAATTTYNRIDIFGNLRSTSYFSTPVLFSYVNNNLFSRPYQYQKSMEVARIMESEKQINRTLEELGYQLAEDYLEACALQQQKKDKTHSLEEMKAIYNIASQRVKIGSMTLSDLLAIEASTLDLELSISRLGSSLQWYESRIKERIDVDQAEEIIIESPGEQIMQIAIPLDLALAKLVANGVSRSATQLRAFQKEQELADLRAKRKISLSVNAFYGLSNTAPTFQRSTANLRDQQLYTVGLRYTIFDFGRSSEQLRLLEVQRQIIDTHYEVQRSTEEGEVRKQVQQFHDLQAEFSLLSRKVLVVRERFKLLRSRFNLGTVTITDLSFGQNEVKQTDMQYYETLKNGWLSYYTLRRLTLYDYENHIDINYLAMD